jgi:hypothetical protein
MNVKVKIIYFFVHYYEDTRENVKGQSTSTNIACSLSIFYSLQNLLYLSQKQNFAGLTLQVPLKNKRRLPGKVSRAWHLLLGVNGPRDS